ncbi:MAG: hypothetical protein JJU11_10645 [Candidatus Sumerlaeia bacterium]|nr:hypothetical protein [Candidatus Sumerlaeia bacterium]
MSLEDEYKQSTRWLGPLFALALVAVFLAVTCARGGFVEQPDADSPGTGEVAP